MCIPDDANDPTGASVVHTATHYGNPLNGEAPLNTKYRYSYIERAQLTGKHTTTVEKKNGVVGTATGTTIADKALWHNNGLHEWLTHDPMRLGDDTYIGRANPRYPDTIPHANRFRFDSSTTYGNGVTAETDSRYLWFSNGYSYTPSILTEVAYNDGRYWIPTCDWDPTYGRKNITEFAKKTGGGHSTGYFDGSEGRPQHAPSLGSDESLMLQQASLVGVLAGEAIPRTRSSSYKDSSDSNLGGNGTPFLYDPLRSPSGKPFMCIQTYRPFNTYRPVIFYEGGIGAQMDGDIFHMRLTLAGIDVDNSGDSVSLAGQDATYKLMVGFGMMPDQTTITQDGFVMADMGVPTDGPMASVEFTIGNLQSGYPYIASEAGSDTSYTLDQKWSDIDIALDFTNQKFYFYVDGTLVSGPTDMGTFAGGQPYSAGSAIGWQLDLKNSADDADSMFFTSIDRVACYHPLNDSVAFSGAGDATRQEVDVLDMSLDKPVDGSSSMQITIADDDNTREDLLFNMHEYGSSELVMWLNTSAVGRYSMIWRGRVGSAQIKQSVDERTKEIVLTAEDIITELDRELASWDIGQDSVSRNEILKARTSEITNFRNSMYFGARQLKPTNPQLGLGRESVYSTTTDQRMQLGSAHPIQIYNNEDTNGPNDAEDEWQTHSSGVPSGVTATDIESRSIHAEWVRDLCKSKWFTKKFGKVGNHIQSQIHLNNFELHEIKPGSGTSITPSNTTCTFLGRTPAGSANRPINAGILQIINDRGGGNEAGVVVMDIYKHEGSAWSLWNNAGIVEEMYRSAPSESLHITSAAAANATTVTITKGEHSSSNRCARFTSVGHGLSDGDKVMIYGLSGTNVQSERVMSHSASAPSASNDNGYGIDIKNENCYFVRRVNNDAFRLLPSSYTDKNGKVYIFGDYDDAYGHYNASYAHNIFGETNTIGPGGSHIDFVSAPYNCI